MELEGHIVPFAYRNGVALSEFELAEGGFTHKLKENTEVGMVPQGSHYSFCCNDRSTKGGARV